MGSLLNPTDSTSINMKDFAIIGGGISGLSAAYYLHKRGKSFVLLEKEAEVGGALKSSVLGDYRIERGANTVAMNGPLQEIIQDLGLEAQVELPAEGNHNRYIYRSGQLHALTQSPLSLFKSSLLSRKAKFRLIREPFIKSKADPSESVAQFFSRRIGKEAYEFLVAAGLQGIYAGIPEEMHMASVMPAIVEMEADKGSLLKGLIARQKEAKQSGAPKRTIFALKRGMQSLAKGLANYLEDAIQCSAEIDEIRQTPEGFSLRVNGKVLEAKEILYTAPAHSAQMLSGLSPELATALLRIPYAPMMLLHLAYERKSLGEKQLGFGFLIPPKEGKALLGAIWNSALFEQRAKKEHFLFTLFIGGARQPHLDPEDSHAHIEQAQLEFEEIMGIKTQPVFREESFWKHAIPQYNLKHPEILSEISHAKKELPGFHLLGNYIQGVAVGDCVLKAKKWAQDL
ncbi:MAG: protoporphyrinogen oxidase [Bacteroidota bacterium]